MKSQTHRDAHMNLEDMPRRTCAVIERIEAEDDDMLRLMSMGICRGRTVEIVQQGDPLILRVYGSRIGVSARLAQRVYASPCKKLHCPVDA